MSRPERHSAEPKPIHPKERRWLDEHLPLWVREGLISEEQALALDHLYESGEAHAGRRSRTVFFTLTGLAVLLAAVGLLLIIAHNWDEIGRTAKVAGIFALVAGAFASSAAAYSRGRLLGGELLALLATLAYGNAIWLLAQVFHIQAHYPDGVFWWMLGALVAALLLRSQVLGVQAVVLMVIWAGMEADSFDNAAWSFLVWAALAGGLALSLRARPLFIVTCLGFVVWLMFASAGAWQAGAFMFPLVALAGCALYAGSVLVGGQPPMARSVEVLGTVVLLFGMIPLTFTDYHAHHGGRWLHLDTASVLGTGVALLALVLAGWGLSRRTGRPLSWVVPATAGAAFLPLCLWEGIRTTSQDEIQLGLALLFSATSILVSIWLIQTGIARDRGSTFFTGVVYLLLFVLIRYFDLIGDMLSAAGIFFIAAVILMATARYWMHRRKAHG